MSQVRLTALYRLGQVGLVTPLRDGMNLVAKEYVAAQDPDDPGVLVLSQFAGAAERLEGALLVNPYDLDEVAESLHRALQMPLEERLARWTEMMAELRVHDIHNWRNSFISALTDSRPQEALRTERNFTDPQYPEKGVTVDPARFPDEQPVLATLRARLDSAGRAGF